jgi:hypothetical protein
LKRAMESPLMALCIATCTSVAKNAHGVARFGILRVLERAVCIIIRRPVVLGGEGIRPMIFGRSSSELHVLRARRDVHRFIAVYVVQYMFSQTLTWRVPCQRGVHHRNTNVATNEEITL